MRYVLAPFTHVLEKIWDLGQPGFILGGGGLLRERDYKYIYIYVYIYVYIYMYVYTCFLFMQRLYKVVG